MSDAKSELKGLIKEIMGEETLKAAQEKQDAEFAKLKEENSALVAKMEEMSKGAGTKVNLESPTGEKVEFIYKGYDLRRQMVKYELPELQKESASKFIIDVIHGKTLNEDTGSAGGYLVPDEYENSVLALAALESVALRECQIFNVGRDVLKIPTQANKTSVNVAAYGTANTESEPSLGLVTLDMKRIGNYSLVYNDLLEDSFFDISSWITKLNAEAIGQSVDEYVFVGSSFTNCLYDCTTNLITLPASSGVDAISYEDFSEAISKLTDNKLAGAKWYFNKAITHYVRTEEDSQGRPIWVSPGADSPASIYGYPYMQVEELTASPATSGAFGVFGNLQHYALGVRKGITMQMNPYVSMKEGITQFICHTRMDGAMLFEPAFVLFKRSDT